jgi:hypothetical protein
MVERWSRKQGFTVDSLFIQMPKIDVAVVDSCNSRSAPVVEAGAAAAAAAAVAAVGGC